MNLLRRIPWIGLLGLVLILFGQSARADLSWTVSLDTSRLAADYTGPFALDFELVGSNGNTVTLSNFSFGSSGNAGPGSAFLTGGASGNLGTSVSFNDSASFFSDFNQQFTPGTALTFTMNSTLIAPPSGGTPDNFSMAILSHYETTNGYNFISNPPPPPGDTSIPTTDTAAGTFFNFNINGAVSTTVSSFPSASGDVSITVTPTTSVVPEPSTAVAVLFTLAVLGVWRCRRPRGKA